MITGLNVNAKIINILEQNIEKIFHNFETGKNYSGAQSTNHKNFL